MCLSSLPPLSVCVPAYNEERHIQRCLRSISAQQGVAIEEILVGVNSSTDGTRALALAYAEIDPRVRVVDSPKGKVQAWNALNAAAKNDLRIFQDGDCCVPPKTYARLLDELDGADIIGASLIRHTEGAPLVPFILNFPKRHISPRPLINGNLYLMDYPKIRRHLERKLGMSTMPEDIINEDAFLQALADRVKVSTRSFVQFTIAETLQQEIRRQHRMRIGNLHLLKAFPQLVATVPGHCTAREKLRGTYRTFLAAEPSEKLLFPFVSIIKYILFRYIKYRIRTANLGDQIDWDLG